ncbi:MAG: hypothetical protein HYX78_14180 [Armatimonadetes bacterium]|nr:hypothetical protein [Armatimonadota bacterium]
MDGCKLQAEFLDSGEQDVSAQSLEDAADELLGGAPGGARIYSERALTRKIRTESVRLKIVDETQLPEITLDYLLHSQIRLLIDSSRLTRFQASVLALSLTGWDITDIASRFRLGYNRVARALQIAERKVSEGGSPYDGIYEVYWQEVHRYIYRRRRTGR